MATSGFDWQCRCGEVHLQIAPGRSREITCYCNYCRHFAEEFGEADTLDAGGGVALVQLLPERIRVVSGGDQIACLTYSKKGPLRWFARCCDTPISSTVPVARMPFVSMHSARLEPAEALGPVLYCAHAKSATGPVAEAKVKTRGAVAVFGAGMVAELLGAWASGRWRRSPFFTQDGTPRAAPEDRRWRPS